MVLGDIDQNRWSLGLERVKEALDRLGHPEQTFRHVLVAGTNGKGSTCIYLERILAAGGLHVGTTLSPHLSSFSERFRIDSSDVKEQELANVRALIQGDLEDVGLTYFEWCVVLAAKIFAEHKVDIGIFEIGLGGRFDASNVMDPEISLITAISLDHTDYLGDSTSKIAREKAAIARPGRPLLTTAAGSALEVIKGYADLIGAHLSVIHRPTAHVTGMKGPEQDLNAALAVQAGLALGVNISVRQLAYALNTAFLPGRLESIGGRVIMDVAHNPASMQVLVKYLESKGFDGVGVFGVLADKDYSTMVHQLMQVCTRIHIAAVLSERSWRDQDMMKYDENPVIERFASITQAFAHALNYGKDIVVTGSFYSVGEVRESLVCTGY
ncbi:MAG TPA: hypothetical protein ENN05_06825 [Deltaproteobacteria bacterium]|nr:hypothetical protein [Deltaproteobacteria bacterium]